MSLIVKQNDAAHWYTCSGEPMHTVIAKGTGLPRNTTLADARKLNLLPSVTSILGMLNRPALNDWKMEMAIEAALTTPRREDEDLHQFAVRCAEEAQSVAARAADFGTRMHDLAAQYAKAKSLLEFIDDDLKPYIPFLEAFFSDIEEVINSESFVVGNGYAGRIDLLAITKSNGVCLFDFKTKKFKNGKADFWPDNVRQLAAYREALGCHCALVNVGINSQEPRPFCLHQWDEDEAKRGLEIFMKTLELWQLVNNYKPTQP